MNRTRTFRRPLADGQVGTFTSRTLSHRPGGPALLLLMTLLVVGCGSDAAGPSASTGSATPSAPAERIAFGRWGLDEDRGGPPTIWTADPDGGNARPVGDQRGWYLEWSPDRSRIIFDAPDGAGNEQISHIAADGTGLTQLTTGTGFFADPHYSPDGANIVFTHAPVPESVPTFQTRIWVMSADGTDARALVDPGDSAGDFEPEFSPDGTRVTFSRDRSTGDGVQSAVVVANSDGSDAAAVTPFADGIEHPRWSPDGRTVIYNIETRTRGLDDPANGIWTVPASGGEPTQLRPTDARFHVFKPSYSPDGTQILFGCAHRDTLQEDLCVMNADGSEERVIIETPEYENHGVWR